MGQKEDIGFAGISEGVEADETKPQDGTASLAGQQATLSPADAMPLVADIQPVMVHIAINT